MKIHRFIGDFVWKDTTITSSDPELIHQLRSVLKLEVSEEVVLGDGISKEALASLTSLSPKQAVFSILKINEQKETDKRQVHLFVSILKRDNFEWVAQKAVECGVTSITPILCDRTIKTGLSFPRIKKIMHEAAEQSGRITLATLSEPCTFKEAVLFAEKLGYTLFLGEKDGEPTPQNTSNDIALLIGPEGGFTPEEKEFAKLHGAHALRLGEHMLRAETAAIVGVYALTLR